MMSVMLCIATNGKFTAEAEKRGMDFAVVAYAGGVYRWA